MSINHVVNNTINLDCKSLKVNNQPLGSSGKFLIEFAGNLNATTLQFLQFQTNQIGAPENNFYSMYRIPFKCKILSFKVYKEKTNPKLFQVFLADSNNVIEIQAQQLNLTNTEHFKLITSTYNSTITEGKIMHIGGANDGNISGITTIEILFEQVE
jgi:hypothetical protein